MIRSVAAGLLFGSGIATTFPYEAGAFLKTRPDLLAPDIQVHFMPALESTANLHIPNPLRKTPLEETHGFTLRVGPIVPESRGWIGLRSADPAAPALIQPNYLEDDADCRTTVAGIRMVREVIAQPAFAAYRGRELAPGDALQSDVELTAWLRASAMTTFHPVGTLPHWARIRWRWWTRGSRSTASPGSGSPMPPSCRSSRAATPTRRPS